MRLRLVSLLAAALLLVAASPAGATFPYPAGGDPYDYTRLHIQNGACPKGSGSDLPANFDCTRSTKLTDLAARPGDADYDPAVVNNPQELFGVKGSQTNRAWEVTTGRPDTIIAVMDSGIIWDEPALANKVHLNYRELPVPGAPDRSTNWRDYDGNGDGVFNVRDYAGDARVTDPNHNGRLDAEDLILTFSDSVDDDQNGYIDDIAGWDFYQHDNDPADDVTYGHGTGEAKDSSAEVDVSLTQCPNCMFVPLRVGDSFIAEINDWAEGVVYATDNGVSVIQEALGTVNHTGFAQAAADYAFAHGVVIDASEADEAAGHHNYPAALNHTMVVNSVTHYVDDYVDQLPAPLSTTLAVQLPKTYLAFNGCTNFGGYTWVSVSSNSCSSDATGQSSGIAGLVYSAARNAIDLGVIGPDASGRPLAAEEVKQIMRLAADDIDFSTPQPPYGPPNNFATTLPGSARYVTAPGWDQISGWGRLSANKAVRIVAAGQIPPQADVVSPRWWQPLGTRGSVDVVGAVSAPRAGSYTYRVEFAPGVQPPRWPLSDSWTTVATGVGSAPKTGVLARLDLAQIHRAIVAAPPVYTPADDPTARDLPEKDAFRVRVVVSDDRGDTGDAIEQRQYFSVDDPTLMRGFPTFLNADGAGSPAFADIDGDGRPELVVADGNGFVHAFRPDGGEAAGWPQASEPLVLPNVGGFARGAVPSIVYQPFLLGSPAIADLDGDGLPEIAAADADGILHVWHNDGSVVAGFPVRTNLAYSHDVGCQEPGAIPACDRFAAHNVRDHVNTVERSFVAHPAAGNIDPAYPGTELVIGAEDGHVYAWHADGSPVPGWPVLLRDPKKVSSVDPVSHRIAFKSGANAAYGRQVIAGVSLGDVNGDGVPEIAVNVDEEYDETPNWSVRDPALLALGVVAGPGNTRTYLLWPDGRDHAGTETVPNLGDNAYVPGWPVPIGMIQTELLPDVGSGSDGAPVFADVDGDGVPEIATASIGTPPYLLKANGTSFFGNGPDGRYLTMASELDEFKSAAIDGPSVASLGGATFGRLGGPTSPISLAMGATGLRRLLDVVLPEQQLGAEDHIDAWNARTGTFEPGFPAQMNDLMFFNSPAIADVSGDGKAEVLQGSAMYDLRAYGLGGIPAPGFPKFTGGWSVSTAGTGDFNGDGKLDVAMMTREGELFVWRTLGAACQTAQWPKYQHDLANSGNYAVDATPPSPLQNVTVTRTGTTIVVTFTGAGDDALCGVAASVMVKIGSHVQTVPLTSIARVGGRYRLVLDARAGDVSVQAVDDAGNRGFPMLSRFAGSSPVAVPLAVTGPAALTDARAPLTGSPLSGRTVAAGILGLLSLGAVSLRTRAAARR